MLDSNTMHIETRIVRSKAGIEEAYITALPSPGKALKEQAEELFEGVKSVLTAKKLLILQERVFATREALKVIEPIRARVYGAHDDGVAPAWLVTSDKKEKIAGVQVHAVSDTQDIEIIKSDDIACGRVVRSGKCDYLTLSGICVRGAKDRVEQSRAMLEKGEAILKQLNLDMFSVWYDDFNQVRNQFFFERKIISESESAKMPASTGIGISPRETFCAMDVAAVTGTKNTIEYLDMGGNQNSAFKYGSAFSRATIAATPAGKAVFISGTASIDHTGETTCLDDAEGQISETIKNVRAVLRDSHYTDSDFVHVIAYCKTVEVEKLFLEKWSDLGWPCLTAICDVCRENLLFEIEATAVVAD